MSLGDVEEAVLKVGQVVEECLDAAGLGVGEEDLAEAVAADEGDELAYAVEVELVEDVVEQEDGFLAGVVEEVLELGQFEGKCEALLLPL